MVDKINLYSKQQAKRHVDRRRGRTEIKICELVQILEEPKSGTCHQAVLLCLSRQAPDLISASASAYLLESRVSLRSRL